MLVRRLSFLLALALLGSFVALAPAGAEPVATEVGLTHITAPTPNVALAAKAPLQCTKQAPLEHDEELRELKLHRKARWCGGQVRVDDVGGPNNGILASFDGSAALDVDVTLPRTGSGPFPLIVMLHGLGGSRENFWREPAQYAARGYAVLDYTARSYHGTDAICLDKETPSRTVMGVPPEVYEGYGPSLACRTQLGSRHYEVRDTQYLASRLVDGTLVEGVTVKPDIGVYGLSYGGGQTWMLTRDNTWKSPAGKRVRVKAAVPVIGWSDLLDALVPNGRAGDTKVYKSNTQERRTERLAEPIGVAKESYISTFFAGIQDASLGNLPGYLSAWRDAVFAGEPYDAHQVATEAADKFVSERSALYMPKDKGNPAILSVQGFTDVVFPATQSLNMYNLLNKNGKSPYPMNMYFGDFGHPISQSKPDEATYVNKLVSRWFDHYLRGKGQAPKRRVEARTTRCDDSGLPGALFRAKTWSGLQSPEERVFEFDATGSLDTSVDDPRALEIKPIDIDQGTVDYSRCRVTEEPVADGNLGVTTTPLEGPLMMLGLPTVSLVADPAASDMYVSARLWDVDENGAHTLVDRGVFRLLSDASQPALFRLFGNAYTFAEGHTIELELTANDTRSFLAPNAEGTIEVSDITLSLPLANPGKAVVGGQQ